MRYRVAWNFETGDTGLLSPGKFLPLRSIAWAALLFAIAIGFFFASVLSAQWLHLPKGWDYAPAVVLPVLSVFSYCLLVRAGEHRRSVEFSWNFSAIRDLAIGSAIGLVVVSSILLMLWSSGLYSIRFSHWTGWLDSFVFDSYISGILEEIAFRAILLRILAGVFGPITGLILSSLLFGLAHLSHATWLVAAEIAFNGGILLGLLYMTSGRIWMSIGAHIGWDFTEESILGVNNHHGLLLSIPNPERNSVLTGGAYGPDGSLLAALVGSLAIISILFVYRSHQQRRSLATAIESASS